MGYIATRCVSEWAWSRLFWLPAGFGDWSSTKSSHVSVAFYFERPIICVIQLFAVNPNCAVLLLFFFLNWLRIISHHNRIDILKCVHSNNQPFRGFLELLCLLSCGLWVFVHFSFLHPFRLTDTNGFRNWIWDGMQYQPCLRWCSIAVAFNSQLHRSVDGICRQKSVAEIYVTWIGEI